MKVCAIVQARLGSSRLPGKVLADIGGKSLIAHVVERVRACRLVDCVVVAWPDEGTGHVVEIGIDDVIDSYGGGADENDVLGRFYHVATQVHRGDVFARLTGDCPLLDPEPIEAVIQAVLSGRDYANNDTLRSGWPDGCDAEAFTFDMLKWAHTCATDVSDREHVTPWMRRRMVADPCVSWRAPSCADVKLSVDTAEDLAFVRAVYAALDNPTDYSFDATWRAVQRAREDGWCVCEVNKCAYTPCKGECGCQYCHDAYQDFLSLE